jgi:hypothetical protein
MYEAIETTTIKMDHPQWHFCDRTDHSDDITRVKLNLERVPHVIDSWAKSSATFICHVFGDRMVDEIVR